jgi:hypothetical protein
MELGAFRKSVCRKDSKMKKKGCVAEAWAYDLPIVVEELNNYIVLQPKGCSRWK